MARPSARKTSEESDEKVHLNDVPTKIVLRNIVIMVPTFYMILYSTSSITYATFGEDFHIKAPFDFKKCCLTDNEYQANGLSIIISYLLSTFPFLLVTLVRLWDHILTITVFNILLTCLVMLEFPLNWQWWIAVVIGVVSSILFGEITAHCCCQRLCKRSPTQTSSRIAAD